MSENEISQTTNLDPQPDELLHEQWDWLRITLSSVGDAVITTDANGDVNFLNAMAQDMTGWTQAAAFGRPVEAVFKVLNEETRLAAENPATRALRDGVVIELANHTLVVAKDGTELPIDDSATPTLNAAGKVTGVAIIFRDVTQRKQLERQVQEAQEYTDNILATLRDPFLVLDKNLRVVTANHAFYENFQVAKGETQGRFVYDLGNRQWDIPRLRTLLEELLPENQAFQDFEVDHDFSTIGQKFMLLNARRIREPGNSSELILLAIEDVTDRKQQKKLVQDALAYADNIISTLREPFLVLDSDLRVVTANHSFYHNFHVTPEESQDRFIYDLGNRQWDIPRLRTLLEDVLPQNHAFQDFELEHDFPTIGQKTMLLNARRIRKPGDKSELILLAIEDVTDRRHSQLQKGVSETRFRRLFEAAKDGILILDFTSGRIVDANPFMSGLLGYSYEDFRNRELWEIGLFGDKSANERAVRTVQDVGYLRYEHLPLESNDGRRVEVEIVANAYDEGDHQVIQCNIRDITERSNMEKRLQTQAAELRDEHRRKDEFLAMLSHELRSPLAPIANAVQLLSLQEGSESRVQQQARNIIERQLGNLQHLVDDLLEVSRITSGRVQLRQDWATAKSIVNGAVETVRSFIEQKRHTLKVVLPDEPLWLHGDSARLEQVLANLLGNAAKYTEEGGQIWLTVSQDANKCVISVRDNGVGIADTLLPHVFDLFTQAERSLDRSQGGLGIGLALALRLTELHHGTIEAHSTPGEGSEFIVHLPLSAESSDDGRPAKKRPRTTTHPLRILVVDDTVDTAEAFSMLLTAYGHDVKTAFDGLAAVEIAAKFAPEAVVLDIGLPGLDGYEVAKRIRQQPAGDKVILIALTGYGQDSDRLKSDEAGFNHHLVKPANFNQLRTILATAAKANR